jgi:hypothetical protein
VQDRVIRLEERIRLPPLRRPAHRSPLRRR